MPRLFKAIRKELGRTQAEMAEVLSISKKAVESYEQGWREVPDRVIKDILILLRARIGGDLEPCWKTTHCPDDIREQCPAYQCYNGQFCWFSASSECQRLRTETSIGVRHCLTCPVVRSLLPSF